EIEAARILRNGDDPFHTEEFRARREHWMEMVVFGAIFGPMSAGFIYFGIQGIRQLGIVGCLLAVPFAAFFVEAWSRFVNGLCDRWQLQGLALIADDGVVLCVRLPHTPIRSVLAAIAMAGTMGLMFVWALSFGLLTKVLGMTINPNWGFPVP